MCDSLKKKKLVILFGDFNSKVIMREEENSIGSFPKGYRNKNEERVVELCYQNKVFITKNSLYQGS